MTQFTTNYNDILKQIENIDPGSYARTRNFLNGNVTMLSPYLTHGVISLNQIKTSILCKYKYQQAEKLIFELAWKEYFLRVWESKGEDIWSDLKHPQDCNNHQIPKNLIDSKTGINAVDKAITELYSTGYMHNHARMWTASLTTNIAKCHWKLPSQWMYYHLLDGDLASNTLSWQWIAGSFSSKKYFANQENLNKYADSKQLRTYLDIPYESFDSIETPLELEELQNLELICDLEGWTAEYLRQDDNINVDKVLDKELLDSQNTNLILFHPWCLDPNFGSEIDSADKILLLEPSHFQKYPMSQKRINFILDLTKNIEGIRIIIAEVGDLNLSQYSRIITRQYPAIEHWSCIQNIEITKPDYMFPSVFGYFGSFMGYWKKCERML